MIKALREAWHAANENPEAEDEEGDEILEEEEEEEEEDDCDEQQEQDDEEDEEDQDGNNGDDGDDGQTPHRDNKASGTNESPKLDPNEDAQVVVTSPQSLVAPLRRTRSKTSMQSLPSQPAFQALQDARDGDYKDSDKMAEEELARVLEQIRLLEMASPYLA